ncbi:proline iminopeptidase [Gordoniibacillus kamchatkensis]|uniref:Proline iminopeptidase n=2 Tax=Gordoniibacillus kamchatkensis TaxID=1590651 RepID=A0ABR5A9W6_9BACL|nr:proline iminopeptidase [Paenibacillus sp. VKM B-2647]
MRKRNQRKNVHILHMQAPNGIAESEYVQIGGIDQWITIRGEDRTNPVLLFLHGGPGSTYSIFAAMLRPWEKDFTIVQRDQRGTGKTFRKNGNSGCGTITFDRIAQDGIEVAQHVCQKLGQDKVILIGSSAGSLPGILMAARRPDLFHAYVGTDQNSPDSTRLAHRLALDAMREARMDKGVRWLEQMGPDPSRWTLPDLDKRNRFMVKVPQQVPNMIMDLILPALLASPEHTFRDIIDVFKGMNFSLEHLFREMVTFDYNKLGNRFALPFFIFQGESDIITPVAPAAAFFEKIEAPHKEFALIRNAGHLACFAQPEQFLAELNRRVRPLAVKPQDLPLSGPSTIAAVLQ